MFSSRGTVRYEERGQGYRDVEKVAKHWLILIRSIFRVLIIIYYYYWYSALGPVWAETRAQSGDWYGSGTLHPGQVLRGSLPLLSHCFLNHIHNLILFPNIW